jgi:rare lipoprotein A
MSRVSLRSRRTPLALGLALALSACTGHRPPGTAEGERPPAGSHALEGLASWYGPGFAGRPTASGEIYDPRDLTCAHRTLPFGSKVLVRNLDNGRTCWVRVTDRGPFVAGRVVDLSYSAAEALGVVGPGTARVRLLLRGAEESAPAVASMAFPPVATEPQDPPVDPVEPEAPAPFWVQVGAFALEENALRLAQDLARAGVDARVVSDGALARVRVGAFGDPDAATALAESLARQGYETVVVRNDFAPLLTEAR